MAAALEYLKAELEFRPFPAQRFVNFDLIRPTHISIRPPATKVLPNGLKIWRLAESEADKLRGEPHSVRYPDIEKRLAAHPFLKGMSPHHIELLALCAMPTEFDTGQTVLREGDATYGAAVNVAARICALSSPDEVLVTEELRRLLSGSDGDGVAFVDRGIYVLKGVAAPRRVFGALQAT